MKYNKQTTIRLASYATALVLVLGGFAFQFYSRQEVYRRQLEASYMRGLQQLSSSINAISADLNKGSYAGTPAQLGTLSTKLWREAGTAKTALTSMPLGDAQLDKTYLFLSQVGDYAMALSRKAAAGQAVTPEERQQLVALFKYAQSLQGAIGELESRFASGEIKIEDIMAQYYQADKSPQVVSTSQQQDNYKEMETGFEGYPKLIYDGPFSDHILSHKPPLLENLKEVSQTAALQKAATAGGVAPASLKPDGQEDSFMPSYCFTGDKIDVGVTKNGGLVTYMLNDRQVDGQRLDVEAAKAAALKYLQNLGVDSMTHTYYEIKDNICTFNLAYQHNDIICYTDLIKVGVALDDGTVVFYDGRGFISNHKERSLPAPALTASQAAKSVSGDITIESNRLALIPSAGQNDLLCYEFKGKGRDDQIVLTYVNAQNGAEEQILLLKISENGTLAV